MKTRILPFKYRTSRRITNWGYSFDSLTELKFAVSIMDDYEFLREPVSIYYHPGTRTPVDQVRTFHRRYTPDFLIRHRETKEAFLVEIKPRMFEFHPKMLFLKQVAESYIRRKKYDWKFQVVFDDEIILSAEQQEEFEHCYRLQSKSAWKSWFEEYNKRFSRISPYPQLQASNEKRLLFVLFGKASLKHTSKWNSNQCKFHDLDADQLSLDFNLNRM